MKNNQENISGQQLTGVDEYLAALTRSPRFGHQVVHYRKIDGSAPVFAKPMAPLPPVLAQALAALGIEQLYQHQARALDLIRAGQNIVVATPTASGKSLVYNLPVFEEILNNPAARVLYLFPLKALAQDQLRAVQDLAAGLPEARRPTASVCDGDTSDYQRKKLREKPPQILISNPDMLHLSMLGYHANWALFWSGLTHVVVDEVHTYRGVFGSHMAWVLRRLLRICRLYGRDPRFIMSSATVANPMELATDLLGRPVTAITETGAARSGRHFVFLNPHDSAGYTASQLLEAALKRGLRTIVYTQSRKIAELVAMWTGDRLGPLKDKLTAYRAGFLAEERRAIEARLTSGELLGVVSTSALELGIDIGNLDICILVGYPGTIMATWQRSGRVGRRRSDSLVVLIAQEDALDQHFMRDPADFFDRPVEAAVLNPDNRVIVRRHLACAAAEHPLAVDEPLLAGVALRVAREMAKDGELLLGADGRFWHGTRKYPHREVDLRGAGQAFEIRVAESERLLGAIDGARSLKECYPGAVYLHQGRTWLSTKLDLEGRRVEVVSRRVNYFTRPLGHKQTEILEIFETRQVANVRASLGFVRVTDTVTGFERRLVSGQKLLSVETLDLPPMVFETEGLWLEIPKALQDRLERSGVHFMGGLHALEHAAIGILPLLVLCDRNDLGGISQPSHPQLPGAAIFIYDGYPGGVGLSRQALARLKELLANTLRTIEQCPCEVGCPSCVHSPKCGSGNRPIDKAAARLLLDGLLNQPPEPPNPKAALAVQGRAPGQIASIAEPPQPPAGYGVFDVETRLSAEEVGGWHRAERMGVSVAVLYDAATDAFLTFREHEMPEFISRLRKLSLVVGFNNKRFDNQVLSAYSGHDLHDLPTLDLLEVVRNQLGYRLSLDHLAEQTLGVKKSADGLMALKWFREGQFDKIIEYCRKDVEITRDLYLFGLNQGFLLFRNKAGVKVRCPVRFGP